MSLRIDVAPSFKRVEGTVVQKPLDYTNYPSGDLRTGIVTKGSNVIPMEGLTKRLADAKVITAEHRQIWVANGSTSVSVKPVKNIGVLSSVDKFFHWLNRVLGEK